MNKENIKKLTENGNNVLPVGSGSLASGLEGEGRMLEPEQIVEFIESKILNSLPLYGKNVLITAGPTYEKLDPVRFIGNNSSGKMGYYLAKNAPMKKLFAELYGKVTGANSGIAGSQDISYPKNNFFTNLLIKYGYNFTPLYILNAEY